MIGAELNRGPLTASTIPTSAALIGGGLRFRRSSLKRLRLYGGAPLHSTSNRCLSMREGL